MDIDPGYMPTVQIGDVMRAGGIGKVIASRIDGLLNGDYVQARIGWRRYPILVSQGIHKIDLSLGSLEDWIGSLGTTCLTAWFGIREIGALSSEDRVLVFGAAGAFG